MNVTRNVYYIHDDGAAELVCGDTVVMLNSEFVKNISKYQWSIGRHGYVTSGAGKNQVLLHRLIINAQSGDFVDHINRNKLDNRISNLRIVTAQQNAVNKTRQQNNTSGYKGVCKLSDNIWQAQIGYKGKSIFVGVFKDALSASKAYDVAAKTLFGEYALLNNVPETISINKELLEKINKKRKKFTQKQVLQIRNLFKDGIRINELSDIFGCSYSAIHRIVYNKTFKEVLNE